VKIATPWSKLKTARDLFEIVSETFRSDFFFVPETIEKTRNRKRTLKQANIKKKVNKNFYKNIKTRLMKITKKSNK